MSSVRCDTASGLESYEEDVLARIGLRKIWVHLPQVRKGLFDEVILALALNELTARTLETPFLWPQGSPPTKRLIDNMLMIQASCGGASDQTAANDRLLSGGFRGF